MKLTVVSDDDGEQEERACCTDERRADMDALFDALPATSIWAIAQELGIEEWTVEYRLSHVRANSEAHGWTVPHAKRGRDTGVNRFYAVLVDEGGRLVKGDDAANIQDGGVGTIRSVHTLARNAGTGLRATALHTRSPLVRDWCDGLAEDFEYLSRKAARVFEEYKRANGE